ncbi:hypothetical protein AAMO2058_000907500 [Amorphochlora amoebiformis]
MDVAFRPRFILEAINSPVTRLPTVICRVQQHISDHLVALVGFSMAALKASNSMTKLVEMSKNLEVTKFQGKETSNESKASIPLENEDEDVFDGEETQKRKRGRRRSIYAPTLERKRRESMPSVQQRKMRSSKAASKIKSSHERKPSVREVGSASPRRTSKYKLNFFF